MSVSSLLFSAACISCLPHELQEILLSLPTSLQSSAGINKCFLDVMSGLGGSPCLASLLCQGTVQNICSACLARPGLMIYVLASYTVSLQEGKCWLPAEVLSFLLKNHQERCLYEFPVPLPPHQVCTGLKPCVELAPEQVEAGPASLKPCVEPAPEQVEAGPARTLFPCSRVICRQCQPVTQGAKSARENQGTRSPG